jgi:cysteine desulfurase family protein
MIYFDNAATTFPKPTNVVNSVNSAIVDYGGNPGRGGHDYAMRVSEKIYGVRNKVARFFNSNAENVVFTCNCTMALNMAIKGVVKQDDHVIISSLEHNAVIRPVYKLFSDNKITYDIANVYDNDERTIADFRRKIQSNTKAIICMHASNVSGKILPLKQIGELCKEQGLVFIVDAAQSAGILPIDIKNLNIDILCTAGHKGLYGITGTGLLVLKDGVNLNTIIEGGTGSVSVNLESPDFYPDRLEAGTINSPGIFSIGAGIDFINSIGITEIYQHEFEKCKYVYDKFRMDKNIHLVAKDFSFNKYVPLVSFNIGKLKSDEVVSILNEKGFALRGGLHCSPLAHKHYDTIDTGLVRFAPSYFSQWASVDKFVKIVRDISKKNAI